MVEEKNEIPNLEIDAKNRVIEQIKEIPLKVNGQDLMIKIKKLNTGERNKIRSECTKISILGGQPQVNVNDQLLQEKMLSAAIVEAPFEHTVEFIRTLPAVVSDYIYSEYMEFAEPSEKKNLG
jgi:hypothetical protein